MASHGRKKVLISTYGTQEDRDRARVLADALGISQSALLLQLLRNKYEEIFGSTKVGHNKP